MEYLYLLIGFVLLLYGGHWLVKSASALAYRLKVSSLIIGLTVVSFGTSAPEFFVSAFASISGHPKLVLGNVVGSNIANIALVLALTSIIFPIQVHSNAVKIDAPVMLFVSLLLWIFMLDKVISPLDGIIFLLLLIAYTTGLFYLSRKKNKPSDHAVQMKVWKAISLFILADIALAAGSKLLVDNASKIAIDLGVSERVVAISLVALGTSLPELSTSMIAAFKKQIDISVGNIIGSNIFNILGVIGFSSILHPISVEEKFYKQDIFWMLAAALMLFIFILPFSGGRITRVKGSVLFLIYVIYIYFLYI